MPQIVETNLPHIVLLQNQRKMLCDVAGFHKLTDFVDIDIVGVLVKLLSVENRSSSSVIPKSLVFALNLQHLLCQRMIGGNLAVFVVGVNAFAPAAGFGGSHGKGYFCPEHTDFLAVVGAQRSNDFLCLVGAAVNHRKKNPVDFQLGIDLPLDL